MTKILSSNLQQALRIAIAAEQAQRTREARENDFKSTFVVGLEQVLAALKRGEKIEIDYRG